MTSTRRIPSLLGALATAVAAAAILAACAGQGPATTEGSDPQPTPTADSGQNGQSAADLDYPMFYDASMLDQWSAARDELATGTADFEGSCSADETATSDDCHAALVDLLRQVNGLKQLWLAFDNSEWDSGDYSGLEALKPTRDATLAASESGSDWSGTCAAASGNEACPPLAADFLGELDALNQAFAGWPHS